MKLSEVVSTQKGYPFKSEWYRDSGVPMVKATNFGSDYLVAGSHDFLDQDMVKRFKKYRLKAGDILVQTVGSWASSPDSVVGRVVQCQPEFAGHLLNQNIVKIIPGDQIIPSYLYYLLKTMRFKNYLLKGVRGSANQANITLADILNFEIELPSLENQEKIVAQISPYDELIRLNGLRINLLNIRAQNLYKELLSARDSTWHTGQLKDLLTLHYGKGLKKSDRVDGQIEVYGSGGMIGTHNQKLVSGPGIILGRKGNAGSVYWAGHDFFPIDTVFYIETGYPLAFVYHLLKNEYFVVGDVAVPGLSRKQAYLNQVIYPPLPLMHDFENIARPLLDLSVTLKDQNQLILRSRNQKIESLIHHK